MFQEGGVAICLYSRAPLDERLPFVIIVIATLPARAANDTMPNSAQARILGSPIGHPRREGAKDRSRRDEEPKCPLISRRRYRGGGFDLAQRRDREGPSGDRKDDFHAEQDVADTREGIATASARNHLTAARREHQSSADQHQNQAHDAQAAPSADVITKLHKIIPDGTAIVDIKRFRYPFAASRAGACAVLAVERAPFDLVRNLFAALVPYAAVGGERDPVGRGRGYDDTDAEHDGEDPHEALARTLLTIAAGHISFFYYSITGW